MRKLNRTNITSSEIWKIFNNNPIEKPHRCAKSPVSKLSLSFTSTKNNSAWNGIARPGATYGERNMKRWRKTFQLGNPVKNLVALSLPSIMLMPKIVSCISLFFFWRDSTIPGRSFSVCWLQSIIFTASVCVPCSFITSIWENCNNASAASCACVLAVSSRTLVSSSCILASSRALVSSFSQVLASSACNLAASLSASLCACFSYRFLIRSNLSFLCLCPTLAWFP